MSATTGAAERAATLAAGQAARVAAGTANLVAAVTDGRARAARWPSGPGPLVHGQSSAMTVRCRQLLGQACETCRAHEAERKREWKRRRAAARGAQAATP